MLTRTMLRLRSKRRMSHVTVMAAMLIVLFSSGAECAAAETSSPATTEGADSFDFAEVDMDGNGCVEGTEEMQLFRLKIGRILGATQKLGDIDRAVRAGRIAHSADVNNDGRICECDLLSILLTETTGPGLHQHAFRVYEDGDVFDSVDANHDGYLADESEKNAMVDKLAKCVPLDKARMVLNAMAQLKEVDDKVSRDEYLLFLSPEAYPPSEPVLKAHPNFLPLLPFFSPGQASPHQPLPAAVSNNVQPPLPSEQPAQPAVQAAPVKTRSEPETQPNKQMGNQALLQASGQAQSVGGSQPNVVNQPVNQPASQPFHQPLAHPQPVIGPRFRSLPIQPFLAANSALGQFPMKYFMAQQAQAPVVPTGLAHPILLSQWLPRAQLVQAGVLDNAAQNEEAHQAQESENQLLEVLERERERAAAKHVLKQMSESRDQAHESGDHTRSGDQTHQSANQAEQSADHTNQSAQRSGDHPNQPAQAQETRDQSQPMGAMAILDEEASRGASAP